MNASASSSSLTLADFARRQTNESAELAVSQPDLPLAPQTLVARFTDLDAAREAVRRVEGLAPADEEIGFVSVGATATSGTGRGVDPEGVAGYVARGATFGAIVGAVLGALAVGLAVAILTGDAQRAIAAAAGGAALFGAVGAMIGTFDRFGGSDAYQGTFVEGDPALSFVGVHVDDDDERLRQARVALEAAGAASLAIVDETGHIVTR